MRRRHTFVYILPLITLYFLLSLPASAQINPWIQNELYDPLSWDTAGPYAATPWLHPGQLNYGQDWGVFSGKWRTTDSITGSWGGFRDRLRQKGIQIFAANIGQLAGNPLGGERKGVTWKGDINTAIFLDLDRLVNWNRTYFTVSASSILPGDTLSKNFIGNFFPVQLNSESDSGSFRIVHAAFGKQLFNNTTEIVLGRIITSEDFATLRLTCLSLNQAICGSPIAGRQSVTFPVYPFATWGGELK